MPSWLEGFGLPPLEALAHGTPSIVSDLAVFAETLGPDGALRVPPGDADALARALMVLSRDASLRNALVEAGTRAIEPYTWKAAADGLYRALGDAIAVH
jgi:glycosyltransferase involved in cell wall biosynthesis